MLLGEDGEATAVTAPAVVLATGGVGQLFEVTTNPPVATGDGWSLAHAVGAKLQHVEFLGVAAEIIEGERPVGIQIYGSQVDVMVEAARILRSEHDTRRPR